MDFRDLIAWQQVTTRVLGFGNADSGPQLVAQQNPSRIYLSISQMGLDDPHTLFPGASPPNDGSLPGIPIGGGSIQLPQPTANAPSTLEFWCDRHGALCQLPWYFMANGCIVSVFVVEVLMDRDPCQFTSTGQMLPAKPRSLSRGRSLFSSSPLRRNRPPAQQSNQHVVDLHKWVQRPPNPDTA